MIREGSIRSWCASWVKPFAQGPIRWNWLGEDYTVGVKRRMSFDEWVYTLTLKKRRS